MAVGDVVQAVSADPQSHPVFHEVLKRSDHSIVRLRCFRAGPTKGDLALAKAPFDRLGVYAEGAAQYGMLALDIGPGDPLDQILEVLRAGVTDGSWEFEEGRISRAWIEATTS